MACANIIALTEVRVQPSSNFTAEIQASHGWDVIGEKKTWDKGQQIGQGGLMESLRSVSNWKEFECHSDRAETA